MVAKEFTVIRSPKTLYEKVLERHSLFEDPVSVKTFKNGTSVKKFRGFTMISTPKLSSSTHRYNPLELVKKPANQFELYAKLSDITRRLNERISEAIETKERLMHKHFLIRLQEIGIHFDETNKESYKDFRIEHHPEKIKVFKGDLFIIEFDRI